MILTVTPNPALDLTYRVSALRPGEVHRVREVSTRAGGKGINVARVLAQLGERCMAVGMGGGVGTAALAGDLAAAGIECAFVNALPELRRTVVVYGDDEVATSFWEPGARPRGPAEAAAGLHGLVSEQLDRARAVTVSGSLPPGVDPALPTRLAQLCAERQVPVVLDVAGTALQLAANHAGGAVVMPNAEELAELTGITPASPAVAAAAATSVLRDRANPPAAIVATLGPGGVVVVTAAGAVWARPPDRLAGNPTGAGDAACAAVARGLAAAGSLGSLDLRDLAADVVAISAAALHRPTAGDIDLVAARGYRSRVVVEEL